MDPRLRSSGLGMTVLSGIISLVRVMTDVKRWVVNVPTMSNSQPLGARSLRCEPWR
jgi:hypothetical protein